MKIIRPAKLLTPSDLRAHGFLVTGTRNDYDARTGVVYEAARRGRSWSIGLGGLDDLGEGLDAYWQDLIGALTDPSGGAVSEAVGALGDDAVYGDGWLYVRVAGLVFWTFVEPVHEDPALARRLAEQLARTVLPRFDPPPYRPPAAEPAAEATDESGTRRGRLQRGRNRLRRAGGRSP